MLQVITCQATEEEKADHLDILNEKHFKSLCEFYGYKLLGSDIRSHCHSL